MCKNTQQIYVRLIDGVEVFVPVVATSLAGELFEVLAIPGFNPADFTSIWEFFPGDTVRCQQYTFTSGDSGLLANELVSSTFPDRKLHELIFLIVFSQGKVAIKNLQGFEKEIEKFCSSRDRIQKLSIIPVIKDWVSRCCKL